MLLERRCTAALEIPALEVAVEVDEVEGSGVWRNHLERNGPCLQLPLATTLAKGFLVLSRWRSVALPQTQTMSESAGQASLDEYHAKDPDARAVARDVRALLS